jgi:hypothetical protein
MKLTAEELVRAATLATRELVRSMTLATRELVRSVMLKVLVARQADKRKSGKDKSLKKDQPGEDLDHSGDDLDH